LEKTTKDSEALDCQIKKLSEIEVKCKTLEDKKRDLKLQKHTILKERENLKQKL